MRRAAIALRAWLESFLGLEGFFLLVAVVTAAVGAAQFDPRLAWFVVAGFATVVGLILAVQRTRPG